MKPVNLCLLTILACAFAVASIACDDNKAAPPPSSPSIEPTRFDEGAVTVRVELVDTGLLKGTANAESKEGWQVSAMTVNAVDPESAKWQVLVFPEGMGSQKAKEFFEIVLQELPRGKQVTITATATFTSEDGKEVERSAVDHWPP